MTIPSCIDWAHHLTAEAMKCGPDLAIDATVGNGHDTLHLAQLTTLAGKVWGFDLQDDAIAKTQTRLASESLSERVHLIKACHSGLSGYIPRAYHHRFSAIMFNLGYLPGGDASLITTADTTLPALESSLRLLRVGGVITVMMYPGHDGSEADQVVAWAKRLDQKKTEALWYRFPNQTNDAPSLLCLERRL